LRDQCRRAGVPFFLKLLCTTSSPGDGCGDGTYAGSARCSFRMTRSEPCSVGDDHIDEAQPFTSAACRHHVEGTASFSSADAQALVYQAVPGVRECLERVEPRSLLRGEPTGGERVVESAHTEYGPLCRPGGEGDQASGGEEPAAAFAEPVPVAVEVIHRPDRQAFRVGPDVDGRRVRATVCLAVASHCVPGDGVAGAVPGTVEAAFVA